MSNSTENVRDADEKYWYQSKLSNRDLFDDTSGLEDFIGATRELASLNKTRLDLIDEGAGGVLEIQNPRFQSTAESTDFSFAPTSSPGLQSSVRSARYNYSKKVVLPPVFPTASVGNKDAENPTSQSFDYGKGHSSLFDSVKNTGTSYDLNETKYVQSSFLPLSFYNPCELDQDHLDYQQIVIDLMLNRPTDLTIVKNKTQKEMLIKTAVRSGDGNVIFPIIIHLRNTMSNERFYQLLRGKSWLRGKEAEIVCKHFIRYVRTFEDSQMVTRELQQLGMYEEAIKFHMDEFNRDFCRGMDRLLSSDSTRTEDMVNYIANGYKSLLSFLGTMKDVQYGKLISQQMFFLDVKKRLFHDLGSVKATNTFFQKLAKSQSPIDILKFTIKYPKFAMEKLGERFNLSDEQCMYAMLQCLAEEQKWHEMGKYVASHCLGKKKGPIIPWEIIAEIAADAPKDQLTNYLRNIVDPEVKFESADRHQCYELAVDTLALDLKDRNRLDTYRNTIPRDSPAYMRAIHYISNMPVQSSDSTNASLTTSGAFSSAMMAGVEMASGINAAWKKERSRMRDFFHRKQ